MRVERRGDPGSGWRLRLRDLQCGAEREIRADLVILTGVREQVTSHNTALCCIYCMQFISKYEGTEVAGAAGSSVHGPAVPQQSVPPRPPAPLHGGAGPGGGMQVSRISTSTYLHISPLVLCSLSGADIAAELSTTAARVLVSAERGAAPIRDFFSGNIERVAAIDRCGRSIDINE